METNYTVFNRESTKEFSSDDYIEEAVDFLKNPDSFRSFDEGLKQIILQKGFAGDKNNSTELADYLIAKLREIGASIEAATVYSWFAQNSKKGGKSRPKIEAGSRSKIYEICFALHLSYKETVWFFEHVYYDRPFNCHTINEAVFLYAFLHNMDYKAALSLIHEIDFLPSKPTDSAPVANYTQFVQDQIRAFQSIDELKKFLIEQKDNFNSWNQSALSTLRLLVGQLICSAEAKNDIAALKRTLARKANSSSKDFSMAASEHPDWGLLIREIIHDAQVQTYETAAAYILDAIKDKNIRKNTFLLERLLSTSAGLRKNPEIPYVVRNNFPSKKTLSDVLSEEKVSTSKSYDSIRKVIILLDFYRFWVNAKLEKNPLGLTQEELAETYRDEADERLYDCGYSELYDGNPYDWIFLCSAQSDDPLEYFRSFVAEILPDEF